MQKSEITGMISKVNPKLRQQIIDWASRWMTRLEREEQQKLPEAQEKGA